MDIAIIMTGNSFLPSPLMGEVPERSEGDGGDAARHTGRQFFHTNAISSVIEVHHV